MLRHGSIFWKIGVTSLVIISTQAVSATYLGIGGGYNDMSIPRTTALTNMFSADPELRNPGVFTIPDANRVRSRSSNYFYHFYAGYLFLVNSHFQAGFEGGYQNYSNARMENISYFNFGTAFGIGTGRIRASFSGINALLVGQYSWKSLFIQGKLGPVYIFSNANSDYGIKSRFPQPTAPVYLKGVENTQEILAEIGANLGVHLTKRITLSFSYAHIFGKKYYNTDLTQTGNYTFISSFKAPKMNLFGLAITVRV